MSGFELTSERVRDALGLAATGDLSVTYRGISTDTRTLRAGELFVALSGERFNGAEFLEKAWAAGAKGAIVSSHPPHAPDDVELLVVEDTLEALGRLAAERRRALDPTVIAITGTSGKTTTRELVLAILGPQAYASPGNFNNLVGLPLSILSAPESAPFWVLEIASNQPGEIERLSRIAEPDLAIITSLGEGHLEGLGDIEGVLEEKLGILSGLKTGGRVFLTDDPPELARRARARWSAVTTVGLEATGDLHPESWSVSESGVRWSWSGVDFELPAVGPHFVRNAMLAVAIGRSANVEPGLMAVRLRGTRLPPMRGELRRVGDLLVLVDCYNANPASFRAAIESLRALARERRRAALVGTMLELGDRSTALHGEIAEELVASGIDIIAATGEFITAFARLSPSTELILKDDLEDAYRGLSERLEGSEAVLLKASRGLKFERAIPLFERDFAAAFDGAESRRRVNGG